MRKLKLHLDSLDVLSFGTEQPGKSAGTVNGHVVLTQYPCQSVDICYTHFCVPSQPCPTH